jgi:hypothetical protein
LFKKDSSILRSFITKSSKTNRRKYIK